MNMENTNSSIVRGGVKPSKENPLSDFQKFAQECANTLMQLDMGDLHLFQNEIRKSTVSDATKQLFLKMCQIAIEYKQKKGGVVA